MASWTRGGRELLYEGLDGQLMAVDIDTQAGFRPGTPRPMFTLHSRSFTGQLSSWGCDAQGERFYVLEPAKSSPGGSVEVISDFAALVHRK